MFVDVALTLSSGASLIVAIAFAYAAFKGIRIKLKNGKDEKPSDREED